MLQALALRDRSRLTIVIGHIERVKSILAEVLGSAARRKDMVADGTSAGVEMCWSDNALEMRVDVDKEGVARLSHLAPRSDGKAHAAQGQEVCESGELRRAGLPLLDVVVAGSGRSWSGRRYSESVVGHRMRYVGHSEHEEARWQELAVDLEDPGTGLVATVLYRILRDGGVLRSWARLTNRGEVALTLESVTSFLGGGLAGPGGALEDVDLLWGENDWLAESRWHARSLRDALPDVNRTVHEDRSRGRFALTSEGSWSSGTYLPMGALANRRSGHTLLWQIEHSGGWHWQVGEHRGAGVGSSYLALLGPTDAEHHWRLTLQPGERFETVPVALALSYEGFEGAVARMTRYRRALRRPHQDHRELPVIFNDYMNTLMGDPTTERLAPLITAAARAGAEYFCIDAGWYAEIGEGWWDTVGSWAPSTSRFPNGITEVLDRIRAEGMVPGLWLEPEVVGVRSPVAEQLPPEAFFVRQGKRVVEHDRYHLDLSHPAAVKHLDQVVDSLVGDLGVGYLKLDYNINVGPGTEPGDVSAGVGLLAHNRAFLDWVDGALDRHHGLTIENCASGGMRSDYALLSRLQLQSTSDQQDYLRYPSIAAAAPVAIAPEQAAVWAYPQPAWSDDEIVFTLCSALLGRVHLSGHIDRMTREQQQLVADAVMVYKRIRADLAGAVPFWPLGLPGWTDSWVALGMRVPSASRAYVVVWHRGRVGDVGGTPEPVGSSEIVLPVAHWRDRQAVPKVLYPVLGAAGVEWSAASGQLTATLPHTPSACLIQLGLTPGTGLA
jgi:alpha-galactosidase